MQRPGGADVIVAEEIGADRLRQGGIVEQDREVLTGLLAVALSSGSDLRAVRITGMHAIGRSVLGLAFSTGTRARERSSVSVDSCPVKPVLSRVNCPICDRSSLQCLGLGGLSWVDEAPVSGLQAEFLMQPAGIDCPTGEGRAYRFVVTDRIRFHRLDARARFGRGAGVPLAEVPVRAFSEVLRDADLFTSVASIGLDPGWQDAGLETRPPGAWLQGADAYWNWAQGADLSASAETRRQLLAILLPGMELGRVATLDGRHLVVTGKHSRYRIHLGSAAVHDLGRDRHLCIQPARRTPAPMLRLEGDEILSIILSKAMLLARDDRITDPSILRQMN